MRREAAEAHDELVKDTSSAGFDQTAGLTASRISLVGNDDLEIDIRIGDIASHLRDDERIDHWRVQLRYMTLLQRQTMPSELNPLGMEPIRRALWALCRESDGNLEQRLVRLDSIEEALKLLLPGVYTELNILLENKGILPAQHTQARQSHHHAMTGAITAPADSLAILQQAMQQQRSASFSRSNSLSAKGNTLLDASAIVALNHLIERMNAFELQQTEENALQKPIPGSNDAYTPLLKSKDFDLEPGQPTAVALDTLALIFEAIYASPDLPDVVKCLLGRLQIPLLKQAVLDAGFFANEQHPARRLISRLAEASLGLPIDVARDHPVCVHLARIVDTVRADLDGNADNVPTHLARLDVIIGKRDEAIQNATRPLVELVQRHERKEESIATAEEWLAKKLPGITNPVFSDFLSNHWLHVMTTACEESGKGGKDWTEAESTIDYLLWSIQPKQTPEERQRLTAGIPALLKKINFWLDRIAFPLEEKKAFLDICFAQQTAALRGRIAEEAQQARVKTAAKRSPSTGQPRLLEADRRQVHYYGIPMTSTTPRKTGPMTVKTGEWLNYTLPDGKQLSGTCCWQAPQTQTVLLFSPATRHALALTQEAIETQLRKGQARKLSGTPLFDLAARHALKQLRGD